MRAGAGIAATLVAAILATAPATAAGGDRGHGRSEQAHQDAPGQQRKADAQPASPGNGTRPAHAGGPSAQTPPPGQAKAPARPAKPAKPAKPAPQHAAKPAKPAPQHPAKPAKPGKPAHPIHAAKPAQPAPAQPANPHAKAGKTTICHATGSATNPYVTITISDNALPAHARHQDGRDLIPAPAGGCPGPAAAAAPQKAVERPGQHGAEAGRPATAPKAPKHMARGAEPRIEVLGSFAEGGAAAPRLRGTLAEATGAERRESGAAKPAAPAAAVKAGQLPFTGLEAGLVAAFGLLLVLAGALLRRSSRGGSPA